MKTLVKILTLFAAVVLLTGCASILGGSGPQAIPVNSNPAEAKLEVTDLITGVPVLTATTPYTMTLKRSAGFFKKSRYKVKVSKEGFLPQERVLVPRISGWYVGNILFGGIVGLVLVDPATGAMYTFDDKPMSYLLLTDNDEGRLALKAEEEQKAKVEEEKRAAAKKAEEEQRKAG